MIYGMDGLPRNKRLANWMRKHLEIELFSNKSNNHVGFYLRGSGIILRI